jgi:hypothetical protein
MRWLNWRRAVAVIAMFVGVGIAANTTPASAAVAHHTHVGSVQPNDWWWT